MKYIFKLLTKAGKISKILGYIYTGLLAASAALEVLVNSLPENKIKKFKKALKFVTVGADAIRKVLGWLGKEDLIENAENEARELTIREFQEELSLEFKNIEEQ